ncbi:BolA family protein [Pseudochelatococcus contaminans]|uniref:BolA protein n=1 Tax=Pseudochelatococcus contaminans TaxID=1538103 RepID=A0A7W6EEE5_9HYPH|nr:BolA family protein [Pseudochelatococcus contaminans]MBB3808188.1 BolA protein [Pseudochelatococcus contaminans]
MTQSDNSPTVPVNAPQTGDRKTRIARILEQDLQPEILRIEDESHRHAGHGGWREGGETHYDIVVVASAFTGKSRIDRQRHINALLAEEFNTGLHALALTTLTPAEAAERGIA